MHCSGIQQHPHEISRHFPSDWRKECLQWRGDIRVNAHLALVAVVLTVVQLEEAEGRRGEGLQGARAVACTERAPACLHCTRRVLHSRSAGVPPLRMPWPPQLEQPARLHCACRGLHTATARAVASTQPQQELQCATTSPRRQHPSRPPKASHAKAGMPSARLGTMPKTRLTVMEQKARLWRQGKPKAGSVPQR